MDPMKSPEKPLKRPLQDITLSPIRENLLARATKSPRRVLFQSRYLPDSPKENNEDLCRGMVSRDDPDSNFIPFKRHKEFANENPSDNSESRPVISNEALRRGDQTVKLFESLNHNYSAISESLKLEIVDQEYACNENVYKSPLKKPPAYRILHYSPKKNLDNTLFDQSPSSPMKRNIKTSLRTLQARNKDFKRIQPIRILDSQGATDDYYTQLVDWSETNNVAVAIKNKLYSYNFATEKTDCIYVCPVEYREITSIRWSKYYENRITVGTSTGTVLLIDARSCRVLRKYEHHDERVGTIDWMDHCFTTGSKDKTILHFDSRNQNNEIVNKFKQHNHEVCGLKWSPGGTLLASGGNDNKVCLWNLHKPKALHEFKSHSAAVRALDWSPHEHGVLASGGGSTDKCVKIWNALNFTERESYETTSQICNVAWLLNSTELMTTHGFTDNMIGLWKYPEIAPVTQVRSHTRRVLQLSSSPCGNYFVTAGDETIRFWKLHAYNVEKYKKSNLLFDIFPSFR